MTRPTQARGFISAVTAPIVGTFRYLFETGLNIFRPNQDNYPETGVQPFEGDPTDNHH